MRIIKRPGINKFPSNEPGYLNLVTKDELLIDHLSENFAQTKKFLRLLPESIQLYRYAEDQWTVKEVVIHLIDMERIYSYRAFYDLQGRIKRNYLSSTQIDMFLIRS